MNLFELKKNQNKNIIFLEFALAKLPSDKPKLLENYNKLTSKQLWDTISDKQTCDLNKIHPDFLTVIHYNNDIHLKCYLNITVKCVKKLLSFCNKIILSF